MKMEKDKIPWMLPKTLMIDLCHPRVWASTLKAQVYQKKKILLKKKIQKKTNSKIE